MNRLCKHDWDIINCNPCLAETYEPKLTYGDKCPDCGSTFLPETPCDFGYCSDLLEEEPKFFSTEFLRET